MCKNGPKSDNPLGSGCWFYFYFILFFCRTFVMLFAHKGASKVL